MRAKIHVESLFCDDIRQEVSGKKTYVGVYQACLILESMPARISMLVAQIDCICFPASELPETDVVFQLRLGNKVLGEHRVEQEEVAKARKQLSAKKSFVRLQMLFRLPLLKITRPGTIRGRVIIGEKTYRAPGLAIMTREAFEHAKSEHAANQH